MSPKTIGMEDGGSREDGEEELACETDHAHNDGGYRVKSTHLWPNESRQWIAGAIVLGVVVVGALMVGQCGGHKLR